MIKYADDSYILIPAENSATVQSEMDHVSLWAEKCNMKLNHNKINVMIVTHPGSGWAF